MIKLYCIDERVRSSVIWTIYLAGPIAAPQALLDDWLSTAKSLKGTEKSRVRVKRASLSETA